jgi:predicted nucleotidyltransferase
MRGLEDHRAQILRIAAAYGASRVRIVEPDAEVDGLDVLVDMEPGRSLFDLVDLGQELGELLGRPVDVIAESTLSPTLRAKVLATAREL